MPNTFQDIVSTTFRMHEQPENIMVPGAVCWWRKKQRTNVYAEKWKQQ